MPRDKGLSIPISPWLREDQRIMFYKNWEFIDV